MLTDKGKGWAGITVRDPALLAVAQQFMSATHWRGPCEIELMRDKYGQYHLIEINPRFPAWVYLSAGAGMNLPYAAVELEMCIRDSHLTQRRGLGEQKQVGQNQHEHRDRKQVKVCDLEQLAIGHAQRHRWCRFFFGNRDLGTGRLGRGTGGGDGRSGERDGILTVILLDPINMSAPQRRPDQRCV